MKIEGKTVIITGGTGGIGQALVAQIIAKSGKPVILSRTEDASLQAPCIACDLSTTEGALMAGVRAAEHKPDILINLAGIQYFGALEAQEPQHIAALYTTNLIAPVLLTQAVLPGMRQRKCGQIVNIGSIFGSIAFAHFATYSSAKAGLKAFSEALRRELHGSGVGVTYIAPRAVQTAFNNATIMAFAERTRMSLDSPEYVARRIIDAITHDAKEVYLGFPERFFVRVNALLPRLVDSALAANDRIAATILNQSTPA